MRTIIWKRMLIATVILLAIACITFYLRMKDNYHVYDTLSSITFDPSGVSCLTYVFSEHLDRRIIDSSTAVLWSFTTDPLQTNESEGVKQLLDSLLNYPFSPVLGPDEHTITSNTLPSLKGYTLQQMQGLAAMTLKGQGSMRFYIRK